MLVTRRHVILGVTAFCLAATAYGDDLGFHAFPNPFVAGYTSVRLAYTLPAGGEVTVRVYSIEGELVREVLTRAHRDAGEHRGGDRWDGRDDDGDLVGPGPYVAVLEARVAGEIKSDTFVIVVER